MAKKTLAASLIILITILLANLFAKPSMAADLTNTSEDDNMQTVQAEQPALDNPELSCANPTPAMVSNCQAMEAEILASTVRLLMFTPLMQVEGSGYRIVSGMGHATIKDGRYLVTHNHYEQTLTTMLLQGDPENLITVNIFDTNGEMIFQLPGRALSMSIVDRETVVFDLGEKDGSGFFDAYGLPSARFLAQPSVSLKPGMQVAQIDWDGNASHVDWVSITTETTQSGIQIIQVSNCVMKGASGGGVYWQGQHIGNNWSRSPNCDQDLAAESPSHTSVALNSQLIMAP